jgi:hypothetical protein
MPRWLFQSVRPDRRTVPCRGVGSPVFHVGDFADKGQPRRLGREGRSKLSVFEEDPVRDRTLPCGPAQRHVQRKKTCDSMQLLSAPHSASYELICLTFSLLPLPVLSTWPWWPGWSPCACCFFAFAWPSWCSDSEPSGLLLARRFGTPALHSCRRITSLAGSCESLAYHHTGFDTIRRTVRLAVTCTNPSS